MPDSGSPQTIELNDKSAVAFSTGNGDWKSSAKHPSIMVARKVDASVSVSFRGTQIAANGFWKIPGNRQTIMTFATQIDGEAPVVTTPPNPTNHGKLVKLFNSRVLSCDTHTLSLNLTVPHSVLALQNFSFVPCIGDADTQGIISSVPATPSSSSTPPDATSTTSAQNNMSSASSSSHTHLVIGVVVGVVVGLLLLLGLAFFVYRRRGRGMRVYHRRGAPSAEFINASTTRDAPEFAQVTPTSASFGPIISRAAAALPMGIAQADTAVAPPSPAWYPDEKAGSSTLEMPTPAMDEAGYLHAYLPESKEWLHRQEQNDLETGRRQSEVLPQYQLSASGAS